MRFLPTNLSRALAFLLAVVAPTITYGQQITVSRYAQAKGPPPKRATEEIRPSGTVHRIELYSGPHHSVTYLPSGQVPTSDRMTAREMERAENEQIYVRELERLKQQYVNAERVSEPQRRAVQKELYGKSTTSENSRTNTGGGRYNNGYGGYGGYGGNMGYGGFGALGGYAAGLGGMGYGGLGGYGGMGYGNRRGFYNNYTGTSSDSVTRGLQFGVGDEGRFKDEMVKAIAQQTSPEYAEAAQKHYQAALSHAATSPTVAKALSLPKTPNAYAELDPSYPKDSEVVLWLGTEKYTGIVKADRPDWLILQTDKGELRVRKSAIVRAEVRAIPASRPGGGTIPPQTLSANARPTSK